MDFNEDNKVISIINQQLFNIEEVARIIRSTGGTRRSLFNGHSFCIEVDFSDKRSANIAFMSNPYFKLYNADSDISASASLRICVNKPEVIYHYGNSKKDNSHANIKITTELCKELNKCMETPVLKYNNITVFEAINLEISRYAEGSGIEFIPNKIHPDYMGILNSNYYKGGTTLC